MANLLLVRTETRQSEIAIRTALGASRRALLKLLLTESFLLSFLGAGLGLLFSVWAVDLILTTSPIQLPSFVNVTLDRGVILFAGGLAAVTGILMGLAPALHAGPGNLHDTLKTNSAKITSGKRFRSVLVVGEIALTFVLLVSAGLLIESFRQLSQVNPGFQASQLLTLNVTLARETKTNAAVLRDAIAALPGVESAALSSDIPFRSSNAIFYTAEGQATVDATNVPRAYVHRVMPGFFKTMRIPLINGRDFESNETEGVVIVSENVVKRFWPGLDPIGKRIKNGGATQTAPWLNIVGVIAATKTRGLPDNPTKDPDLYYPFLNQSRSMGIMIRTLVDPAGLTSAVRNEVHRIEKTASSGALLRAAAYRRCSSA